MRSIAAIVTIVRIRSEMETTPKLSANEPDWKDGEYETFGDQW